MPLVRRETSGAWAEIKSGEEDVYRIFYQPYEKELLRFCANSPTVTQRCAEDAHLMGALQKGTTLGGVFNVGPYRSEMPYNLFLEELLTTIEI